MLTALIRGMSEADLDEVLKIAAGDRNAPAWPRAAYMAALEPEARPRRIALVAEDPATNQVAAFAVARVVSTEAELETIVTATGFRRHGLGRMLITRLAEQLATEGATEVLLEVRESNHAAGKFYESLGFGTVGRRAAYYADPAEDALVMSRDLGEHKGKESRGGESLQR